MKAFRLKSGPERLFSLLRPALERLLAF